MPFALVLSSFVSASRIGGAAQQYVLAAHGVDPVLVPTALYGRNPARGSHGEGTPPQVFARMLADIEADAMFGQLDLVITGHFASADQVEIAADALGRIRTAVQRQPIVVVDPIMGDLPKGLYVPASVARAVAERLVPLGDWLTPNLWELGRLAGADIADVAQALAAARALGKPMLVTSAPAGPDEIGILCVEAGAATLFAHQRLPTAPSGAGDLVAASFGAGLVEGLTPAAAAERAARAAFEAVEAAQTWNAPELPVVALGPRLAHPTAAVRIERL
jgi:pyridoxine kinase